MKKVGGLFTCSALALMAFAALPLSAAELAHRWSFNGDCSDSVGEADAMKCGTYVSLYGGRVHMGYGACSHGTGYVDLGTNMLDTTAATIEICAATGSANIALLTRFGQGGRGGAKGAALPESSARELGRTATSESERSSRTRS